MLGAVVLAPMAALPVLAKVGPDRAAWDAAHRTFLNATEVRERFDADDAPSYEAYQAAREKLPPVAWEWEAFKEANPGLKPHVIAIHSRADLDRKSFLRDDERDRCAALIDAHDLELKRLSDQYGREAADAEGQMLTNAMLDAETKLMAVPAPDWAAFAVKLNIAWLDGEDTDAGVYARHLLADARRLAAA